MINIISMYVSCGKFITQKLIIVKNVNQFYWALLKTDHCRRTLDITYGILDSPLTMQHLENNNTHKDLICGLY